MLTRVLLVGILILGAVVLVSTAITFAAPYIAALLILIAIIRLLLKQESSPDKFKFDLDEDYSKPRNSD